MRFHTLSDTDTPLTTHSSKFGDMVRTDTINRWDRCYGCSKNAQLKKMNYTILLLDLEVSCFPGIEYLVPFNCCAAYVRFSGIDSHRRSK